ncbi:enterobactin transporter EntS [Curvivirga sp.]|uniref:enterobactin transporter EntS n=1 Tax=Curvivirga sp. TaxID=2856848 RepID=UPI003B5B74EC
MALSKHMIDMTILRENPVFRRVMIARGISLMGLGFLSVGIPVQTYNLTNSSFSVSVVMALLSFGMLSGLMLGGTLSDTYDRRRLILFARSVCGLGFLGLFINSILPEPSILAIYVLVLWDGFFGALGVAGLLGAMVQIVGREKMAPATALTMIVTRFATIASPALGGLVIALWSVSWNYAFAAFMTLLTVISLWGLPSLAPAKSKKGNPLSMIFDALKIVGGNKALLCLFGMGGLMALSPAIRTVFPFLAEQSGFDPDMAAGLLYAAVPAGTVLGAFFSRSVSELKRPGLALTGLCVTAAIAIMGIGYLSSLIVVLCLLIIFGAALGAVGVVQMALVQKATPDSHLGRVNSLYMAQENLGMIFGAMIFGSMTGMFIPSEALIIYGFVIMSLVILLRLILPLRQEIETPEPVG